MVQTESSTQSSIASLLEQAYSMLECGNLADALDFFQQALRLDFDNQELILALTCVNWWQSSLEQIECDEDTFEYGEKLIQQWKEFKHSVQHYGTINNRVMLAFQHFVFTKAHAAFLAFSQKHSEPDINFKLGQTNKMLGNYQEALDQFLSLVSTRKEDPALLAELADVYDLINEPVKAKAFFREAFYLNPQKIDIELLESQTIQRLKEKVAELGKSGIELEEWIPVYGELWGIFSVKRKLKPIEVSKLRHSIYELETELKNSTNRRMILIPRLITRYFWYLDHLIITKADKKLIDENLLKIKLLDASVYAAYIS